MERAAKAQAGGIFAIFGSGISQNFMEYKLELYKNIKPKICAVGSSRVMQFRGSWFNAPYVNMGGVAGNLAELRFAIEKMLEISPPEGVLLGLDFWWFMPQWEKDPFKELQAVTGSYEYDLQKLKKPWQWLLDGKIGLKDVLAPFQDILGKGFRDGRYGILAQQYDEGFGPDGSWYNTAELSGKKPPFDYRFSDTLEQIEKGIKAFYHVDAKAASGQAPSEGHLQALMEILQKLKKKAIRVWLFIPPLSHKAYAAMKSRSQLWPHLFKLKQALLDKGLVVLDFSNPSTFSSSDCEFIDGFHGGEIAYARILRIMAHTYPDLEKFVHMHLLDELVRDWQGHAMSLNVNVSPDPEIDFNNFGCLKKNRTSNFQR